MSSRSFVRSSLRIFQVCLILLLSTLYVLDLLRTISFLLPQTVTSFEVVKGPRPLASSEDTNLGPPLTLQGTRRWYKSRIATIPNAKKVFLEGGGGERASGDVADATVLEGGVITEEGKKEEKLQEYYTDSDICEYAEKAVEIRTKARY